MTESINVQGALLSDIKKLTDNKLVEELSEVLCISADAAYRRIRNEKLLTIDEIIKLCQVYHLSFDYYIGLSNKVKMVPFIFPFSKLDFDFTAYLNSILQNMQQVQQGGGTVYFSAKDIPMFHCFQLPLLTRFKLYYWQKTMLGRQEFSGQNFSDFAPDKKTIDLCANIYEVYSNTNSVEIWNLETAHGLLSQIHYYQTVGYISADESKELYLELRTLIKHMFFEAEVESKSIIGKRDLTKKNNFKLFYNEVLAADNSIFAQIGDRKAAYMPHIILNFITTFDKEYCDYIQEVFELVMRKSTLVSGVNEKDRSLFFNYILERITAFEGK